eukprot:TRINITY_DN85415_c0_g1_i1.p1 TRINITY_DN85415_c0_g1~~TRINITY_DN85415_c0_g1_i1.p1  ORF type:complete len:2235 (-),score=676.93 TRINITY_DN85415_c0_g1_i1:474-7178(-)
MNEPLHTDFSDDLMLPRNKKRTLVTRIGAFLSVFGLVALSCLYIFTKTETKVSTVDANNVSNVIVDGTSMQMSSFVGMNSELSDTCFGDDQSLLITNHTNEGSSTIVYGKSNLYSIPVSTIAIRTNDEVVIEATPDNDDWHVYDAEMPLEDANGWPNTEPLWIFSNREMEHRIRTPGYQSHVYLSVGLNSVGNLRVAENKPFSMIFGAAGDQTFLDNLMLRIEGLLKPALKLGSSMRYEKDIPLGNGLILKDTGFAVEGTKDLPKYSLTSTLVITTNTVPSTIALGVEGILGDDSFTLTGSLDEIEIGMENPVLIENVSVTIRGTRTKYGVITVEGSLMGKVLIGQVATTFKMELPFESTSVESVTFTLDDLKINSYFSIVDLKGQLQKDFPYFTLEGNGHITTAASDMKIGLKGFYNNDQEWSFAGSTSQWHLDIGNSGIDVNDANLHVYESDGALTVDLFGDVSLGDYDSTAQFNFAHEVAPLINLTIHHLKTITATNLMKNISTIPDSQSSIHSKIVNTDLSLKTITITLDLAQKALFVDGLMSIGDSKILKNVEYHLEAKGEKFAAGFMIHKAFSLDDVVSRDNWFNGLAFNSGAFVLANHEDGLEFTHQTIETIDGIVFNADFNTPHISDQNPSITVSVSGAINADCDKIVLEGDFDGFTVGPHVVLESGSVSLSSVQPHISLFGHSQISIGADNLKIHSAITFGEDTSGKNIMHFRGHVDKWVLKWHSDIALTAGILEISDSGNGFTGVLNGSLLFGKVVIHAKLAYPIHDMVYLDFYAPDILISKTTHLKEVTLHLEESKETAVKFSAKFVEILSAKTSLEVGVTGWFTEDKFVLDGVMKDWPVAQTGITAHNCKLHLEGGVKQGEPHSVTGQMDMDLKLFDFDVKASLPFPLGNNDITLTVSGMQLSKDVVLHGALNMHFDAEGICETMAMSGDITVALSGKSNVDMKTSGTFTKDTFAISAEIDDLKLGVIGGLHMDLKQVKFNLSKTDPNKEATGLLDAKMAIGDIHLDVEIAYPLTHMDIEIHIPTIRLTKYAKFTDVEIDFNEGDKSISLKGALALEFDPHSGLHDLALHVQGTIIGDKMHLEATIPSWKIPVGHSGLDVTDFKITVDTTTHDAAHHTKIDLFGKVALSNQYSLSLEGTFDSNTDVVTLDLVFENSKTIQLSTLFDKTVTNPHNHSIPADLIKQLHHTTIRSASLELVTKPWSISVKGDIPLFGTELLIEADVKKHSDDSWYFTTAVAMPNAFSFSSIIPQVACMDEFKFVEGILAVTNAPSSTVQFGDEKITIKDGVFFEAILPMVHLSKRLQNLKLWSHVNAFTFIATWQEDTSHIQFIGELPKHMHVGKDVTVDGKIVLNLINDKVDLDIIADAHIVLAHHLPDLDAHVEIDITDTGFTLIGETGHKYIVPAGYKSFELEGIEIRIVEENGVFSGDIKAKTFIHDAEFAAEVKIPCPDTQMGVEIILSEKNENLTIGQVLEHTADPSATKSVKVPHDLKSLTKNPLIDAAMIIKTAPLSFTLEADLEAFHHKEIVNIQLEVTEMNGLWGFGFGVGISSPFHFDDVMPSIPLLDKLPAFVNGAFAFAYQQQPFIYTTKNGLTLSVDRGIAFGATAKTNKAILKWTGIEFIQYKGEINFASHNIHLEAVLETDWHLGNLYFYEAGVFLDIGGAQGFDIGILCNMMIKFNAHNQLRFGVKIMFATRGVVLDGYTLDDWHRPFGLKGLTVDHSEAEIGFSWAFVPFMFGISGGLEVGSVKGAMTLYVDPSINTYVIAARLNEFNMGKMVDTLLDTHCGKLINTITGITFKGLDLELNTGAQAVVFNQQTFNPGFLFKVDEFALFHILKGDARVMINPHVGISVAGHIHPFNFLGGLIQVSGYNGASSPASVDIAIGTGMSHFKIDGRIEILHLLNAGGKIAIDDHGVAIDVEFREGILDFIFQLRAQSSTIAQPSDFSIYGEVNINAINAMISHVTNGLRNIINHVDAIFNSALHKLHDWEDRSATEIARNNYKINQMKLAKQRRLNTNQRHLHNAIHHLEHMKAKVQHIKDHINYLKSRKHHCHWYQVRCKTHNVHMDLSIAASWIKEKLELAALNFAIEVVRDARRALSIEEKLEVKLDPRIVALEVENGVIRAGGKVFEAGLKAAQDLFDKTGELVVWGIGRVTQAFEIEKAYFWAGSMKGAHSSGHVKMGVEIKFFGKRHEWAIDVAFPPTLNNIHAALWDHVHGLIHK